MAQHLSGRTDELALLADRAEAARSGRGQAVVVRGPAGVGKTSLLNAFRYEMSCHGATVLHAACAETAAGYGVVRELFEPLGLASTGRTDSPMLRGSAVWALPALLPEGEAPAPGPETRTYSVLHGLYWLAANLMTNGPLVLILDDVHLGDVPSLRWVDFLLRRSADLPLLVLLAERTDTSDSGKAVLADTLWQHRAETIQLGPLPEADIANMAELALGEAPQPSFTRCCADVSGGNPLMIERLLSELRRQRARPDEDGARLAERIGKNVVAASVLARLDEQSEDVRDVAKAIAVLGSTDIELVGGLSGVPVPRVAAAVEGLRRHDLLAKDDSHFVHDMVSSVILERLAPEERDRLRSRAAMFLRDAGRSVEEVAHQLLALPELDHAWMLHVLKDAASMAERRGAPEVAVCYLRKVLECDGDDVAAHVDLARVLGHTDPLSAVPHLDLALERTGDPRARAPIAVQLGMTLLAAQRSPAAVRVLGEVLDELNATLGEHPNEADRELRMHVEAALLSTGMDETSTVATVRARARTLDVPDGDTPTERQLLGLLAVIAAMDGTSPESAVEYSQRVLRLPDIDNGGFAQIASANAAYLADRPDMALDALGRVLADSHRRGAIWTHGLALTCRAVLFEATNDVDEAAADAQTSIEIAEQEALQGSDLVARSRVSLAAVLARQGDFRQADGLLAAVDRSKLNECTWTYPYFLMTRASVRCGSDDPDGALDDLLQCGRSLDETGIANPVFLPWWLEATCLLAERGRPSEAAELVAHGEKLAADWRTARAIGLDLLARGVVSPGPEGVELLEQAVATLAESPAQLDHARATYLLGCALLWKGETKRARTRLRESVNLSVRCGYRALGAMAREKLRVAGGRMPTPTGLRSDVLTGSERRVATLARAGATNREIAESLFVTVRTVETHLTNAYRKLGVTKRADLPSVVDTGNRTTDLLR